MPWHLDREAVPDPPLSEGATHLAVMLVAGRMPPVEPWSLNAAMELIERDVLLHTEFESMEDRFKLLSKGYAEKNA